MARVKLSEVDVAGELGRVATPMLVLHARGDEVIPLSEGRLIASGIPGAEFVELDSRNHILPEHEPAWERFRTERWDSLRLLTPNWMTRLPGYGYRGDDPDGYLSAREVAAMLEDYAGASAAPVLTGTTVTFENDDDIPHLVVADDKSFRSKALDTTDKFSVTLTKAGEFDYFCGLHPKMTGKIIVTP